MSKSIKSVLSLVMVGSLVLGGQVSVQAKDIISAVEDRLVTTEPLYADVFLTDGSYQVSVEGSTIDEVVTNDFSNYSDADLVDLAEKELFHLLNSYKYILEFGGEYEERAFYTYTGEEMELIPFDKYVYSLMVECMNRGLDKSDGNTKRVLDCYMEMVGVRDCILNFSLVTEEFRETQLAKLNNSETFKAIGEKYYLTETY